MAVHIVDIDRIETIRNMPTTHENVHESVFKSYGTMNMMCEMLERGDSRESILMVVKHIGANNL